MMRRLYGLAIVLAAAAAGHAQAATEPPSCLDTATSQMQLSACAATMADAADQRLNKAYGEVLRYVDGRDRSRLIAAQRAWLAFRDADCAFWRGSGGTSGPMNHQMCIAARSDARAKELDAWPPSGPREALVPKR